MAHEDVEKEVEPVAAEENRDRYVKLYMLVVLVV
jgi:hypothetical protein